MRVRWKLAVAAVAAVAATCCVGPRCANKQGGVWGDRHRLLSLRGVVGWKASVICLILQEEQSLARWHRAQLQNGSSEREESRGAGGAARTHARASVAEVAQVIIRLVRQIKPRPSCLCARRSRALVCDAALRCYNLLPALILRVDPLHATLAIRSFFCRKALRAPHIQQCRLLCMLSVCSSRRTNPDGTVVLTGEAPECHRHNRNQSIASESIWAATGSKISSDIGLDSELQIEKWRHFINWTDPRFNKSFIYSLAWINTLLIFKRRLS